ncbi:MAG: sulfatase [Verrucomicrobiae bacterium]|nr:sulfatase [Verrucomicrobiae bacterium]
MRRFENIFILVGLLAVWAGCSRQVQTENSEKPNVLFIAVDDLNDWIEPLGGFSAAVTPNFNRLAAMSTTFTSAHCSAPACSPSRIAVMTGVHPAKSGILKNFPGDGPVWRKVPILKNVDTLEQFFQRHGYRTLAGGKIYHTLAPPRTIINQADPDGWDFWFPSVHIPVPFQVRAPEEIIYPEGIIGERPSPNFTWGPLPVGDEKMADYQIVDWAVHELSREQDRPLFLAVGLTKPHDPWEVPQKYFDQFPIESIPEVSKLENDLEDAHDHGRRMIHKFILQNGEEKRVLQSYLATMAFTDAMLGRLLDGLEGSRYRDNTIVVLWSDHGMHMGEKENWEKFTLWERSTHVPFFIAAPGITKPGTRCDVPVSLQDIYPTLAELIGAKAPPHCDGVSLLPLLHGEALDRGPVITGYQFLEEKAYTVRTADFRYIYYTGSRLEELYNLIEDPNEWHNQAYQPEQAAIVREMRETLKKKVPELRWENNPPEGYKVKSDGMVRKLGFTPLENMKYKNEWY